MKRKWLLSWVLVFTLFAASCNTWPTIIATAEAAGSVTSVFYPQVGNWSSLAVKLLQQAETAAQAYQANKSTSTAAAYLAAIQSIETQLPADLQTMNIPAPDQLKVEAVMNIILDYVEAEAAQVPASAALVAKARMARIGKPIPKRMTKAGIKKRWDTEVCAGDAKCIALVR